MNKSGQWWLDVFDQIGRANDPKSLFSCACAFTERLGFIYCCYGIRFPVSVNETSVSVLDSYPEDWMRHYNASNYLASDPTVQLGARTNEPIVWSDEVFATATGLWADARDRGLRVGLAQSSWGATGAYGLLSLSRDSEEISASELKHLRPRVQWLVENTHRRMQSLLSQPMTPDASEALSGREQEVLGWTADGKTSWEVAQILHISESTVNFHIKKVLMKLGAQNKVQAAVKATALGLLPTSERSWISEAIEHRRVVLPRFR